jgi:dihydrofolate synthase/folylpolyglutamate synthase
VIVAVAPRVDRWHVATLPGARGATGEALASRLRAAGVDAAAIRVFPDVGGAYRAAVEGAAEADRIVAFGSFLTVSAAISARR